MPPNYVAIIDAGSTKSELFLYEYMPVEQNLNNPARTANPEQIKLIPCGNCRTPDNTPIHERTDGDMRGYLQPLLEAGLVVLCKSIDCDTAVNEVPVFVLATAGVRGRADAQTVMVRAWNAVNAFRTDAAAGSRLVYDVGGQAQRSFVIPALDEGVYAWIAMNHDKYLHNKRFGIAELGGKSMQVAYENPAAAGGSSRQVCLFSSKYRVATQSWELGAEESRNGAVDDFLITHTTRLPLLRPIPNPCMPEGEERPLQLSRPPRTQRDSVGTGRFGKCLDLAESHLNAKLGTDSLPHLHSQIFTDQVYALATFTHTWKFFSQLNLYAISDSYDPERFEEAVRLYCSSESKWEPKNDEFLHKQCFAAAWMITLFHGDKGFHLRRSAVTRGLMHFPWSRALNSRATWTRGAVIMFARHGHPRTFCTDDEFPGILAEPAYNETTLSMPSSPIYVADTTQSMLSPSIPQAVAGSLIRSLPALDAGSAFSRGFACGILLLALIIFVYRCFSTRRAAVHPVPVSNEKLAVDVDDQPTMVHVRRFFFNKAKGAVFLAGEDNA